MNAETRAKEIAMTPEERAVFILKVLDTAQWNVYPSEAEIETLSPFVDEIRADYEERRGRGFHGAFMASRSKFIAAAIRQAENDKLEEAARLIDMQLGSLPAMAAEYASGPYIAASDAIRSLKSGSGQ